MFAIIISIICLSTFSFIEAKNGGFSVDLIHRNSQKSCFDNPSLTPWECTNNALQRSNDRANRFVSSLLSPGTISTDIISGNGEYFMRMAIGTPPVWFLGVVDTGSELMWIQCKPCKNSYKQRGPLFNPKNSSTYKDVLCSSQICRSIEGTNPPCFPGIKKKCYYSVEYLDKSFTRGVVGIDTITLGSTTGQPVRIPMTVFGCGHNNSGKFNPFGSGLIGLGGGQTSLISQMNSLIRGKFSYCLVPFFASKNSSKMHFGSKAVVFGTGVVFTPLIVRSNFYYVTLEGLSVGKKRLELNSSVALGDSKGNIMIDSGSTVTYIPSQLYFPLELQIRRAIHKLKPVNDPQNILRLCYLAKNSVDAPIVTMHFTGANVKLNPINTFIKMAKDVQCLAFVPKNYIAILGNVAQTNFLVGYDLTNKIVSFKPTNCTKQ